MKKILLILLATMFLFNAYAQKEGFDRRNVLKISPVELGRAEFKLAYEYYFNQRKSSVLLSPTIILKGEEGDQRAGWRAMAQYRYYLSHLNRMNENDFIGIYNIGFYAGVYGLYLDYADQFELSSYNNETGNYTIVENERTIHAQEGGALVGIQVDITQRFVLDFYIGGGLRFSQESNSVELEEAEYFTPSRGGIFPYAYNGVKPNFGFMVGLLF